MTLSTIAKPADRAEWLAARFPFFNASDAGCLYNVHPFKSLADVAVEKLSGEPADEEQNDAMDRGVRLEPVLLDWIADDLGVEVVVPDRLFIRDRLMSTVDGEFIGNDEEWIEAKTSSHRHDEPAPYWYRQICAQAASTGRKRCHVVWIDSDLRFKSEIVVPDPDDVLDVLARANRFMEFIDLGMFPEGVELRASHLASIFPKPVDGKFVDVDDLGRDVISRWEAARQSRIAAEKAEESLKDEVARIVGDAEGVTHEGRLICTWKANKASERVDYRALEAAEPEVVSRFKREIPGPRVLRATKGLSEGEAA